MSSSPPNEISDLPKVGDEGYDVTPLSSHDPLEPVSNTKLFLFFITGVAISTLAGAVYTGATSASGLKPILVAVQAGLLLSALGTVVTVARAPSRTQLYSLTTFGKTTVNYKELNRAGVPLITTRIIEDDKMINCDSCQQEVSDTVRVTSATDFVLFGIVLEPLAESTENYCNECSGGEVEDDELTPVNT